MRHLSSFAWVLATAVVSSSAMAATDPLEFIETYRKASSDELKALIKKLREEKAPLLQSYNSEELKKKREEFAREKAKTLLIDDLKSKFVGKVNSTDELNTLISQAFSSDEMKKKLADFETSLEARRKGPAGAATGVPEPVEATIVVDGSPVSLVAKISANSDNKPVMEFSLSSDDAQYTNHVRREAKSIFSPTQAQDFFKTEAGKKLFDGKTVEIANFKGSNVDEWSKGAAEQASARIFKDQVSSDLADLAKDKSATNKDSKVFQLSEEIEEMEDKKGRKEELKVVDLDEKIRTWLAGNDAGSMTECEVLLKAVLIEEIPEKTKQQCAESDPKMKQVFSAKAGDKDADGKPLKSAKANAEGDAANPQTAVNPQGGANPTMDWYNAARGCAAYQRQLAAMSSASAMRQATSPVEAIYRSMLGLGFVDCPLYNQMLDNGMIGSPFLYDAQGKAADVLTRNYTQNTYDNYKKLQSASECVRKILSVTTAMLNNLSANGTVDPFMMMDPNIQKMMMHQSAARELMGAIENSMSARVAENKWKMQVGTNGASTGVPVVGGSNGASGGWTPMGGGAGGTRPADRRGATPGNRNGARGSRPSLLK